MYVVPRMVRLLFFFDNQSCLLIPLQEWGIESFVIYLKKIWPIWVHPSRIQDVAHVTPFLLLEATKQASHSVSEFITETGEDCLIVTRLERWG
jgi:hypothetical protein